MLKEGEIMSFKKSVLMALIALSSSTLSIAHADSIGWGNPSTGNGSWNPTQPSQPQQPSQPWPGSGSTGSTCDRRDPWCDRSDSGSRYDQVVEENVQRYFERMSSLDLLIDSYTRNQLLGRKVRTIRIAMASESGRDAARLLANSRQVDGSVFASRDVREYTFRLDSFSNEVGRSLRSLSLEMQGRFYVDKVTFDLESSIDNTQPFPMPSQTEVLRQQINQTFEREGGINLFRQFPLLERQGQIVKRVTIVAMSRGSLGTAMLLENSDSWGQAQAVGVSPTRLTFDLRDGERIGRELQSLRLQLNGSITVLEVSVEIQQTSSGSSFPTDPRFPRDTRGPGRR